jgi:hypothetical protein
MVKVEVGWVRMAGAAVTQTVEVEVGVGLGPVPVTVMVGGWSEKRVMTVWETDMGMVGVVRFWDIGRDDLAGRGMD